VTRRGFTLVELAVAALVGIIALMVAFNAIILLTKGEKSADRDASKALTDARLMQSLLQDLRSSFEVTPPNPTTDFVVRRYATPASGSGPLVEQKVEWKIINDPKNPRITRQVQGESRVDEFSYKGLLDPKNPNLSANTPLAVKLRLEKVSNVRFPP
jgi:type II secretory pathway pseudopilin PulG